MNITSSFLRKSKSGKWVGVLKYRDACGQCRQVTKTFGFDRAEAEALLVAWRASMAGGTSAAPTALLPLTGSHQRADVSSPTVEQAVRRVLTSQLARGRIERSTHDVQLAYCERDLFPALGALPVALLAPADVQTWLDDLCLRTSPASAAIPFVALSKALAAAVRAGELVENPLLRVEKPPRARPKRAYLPAEAVAALERAMLVDWGAGHPYTCAAELALRAGLRCGECCALRWRDVDYNPHAQGQSFTATHVNASVGRTTQGCYLKEPKCPASVREVPVTAALATALQSRWETIDSVHQNWFVCGQEDHFTSPHALSQAFAQLCARHHIHDNEGRRATFHTLRHTFATEAVRLGVDVRTLADLMGHARVDVTLNVYAASGQDARRAAASRLEHAFA